MIVSVTCYYTGKQTESHVNYEYHYYYSKAIVVSLLAFRLHNYDILRRFVNNKIFGNWETSQIHWSVDNRIHHSG